MLKKQFYSVILIASIQLIIGCKPRTPTNNLSVGRGMNVSESSYPAVQQMTLTHNEKDVGKCSFSFIAKNAFLTAAHCLRGPFYFNQIKVNGHLYQVDKLKILINPRHQVFRFSSLCARHDTAIIILPEDLSKDIYRFAKNPFDSDKEKAYFVGYGGIQSTHDVRSDQKRVGTHAFQKDKQHWKGLYNFESPVGNPGGYENLRQLPSENLRSFLARGDSGGPLLNEAMEIQGVASRVNFFIDRNLNIFVDTHTFSTLNLVSEAVKSGAKIPSTCCSCSNSHSIAKQDYVFPGSEPNICKATSIKGYNKNSSLLTIDSCSPKPGGCKESIGKYPQFHTYEKKLLKTATGLLDLCLASDIVENPLSFLRETSKVVELIQAYLETGRYYEALGYTDSLDNMTTSTDYKRLSDVFIQRAEALAGLGRPNISILDKALKKNPDPRYASMVASMLARKYYSFGMKKKALEYAKLSLENYALSTTAYLILGDIYKNLPPKNSSTANSYYQRVREINSDNEQAFYADWTL